MRRTWRLGIVASVTLASATASAANLTNKGGTSDVPTYEGRVYYIKASGASCPSGATCFCNSGSQCTLPSSPTTITGTVVIDRPGVTLDCQNRIIQPPRFAGTRQVCTGSDGTTFGECGHHVDTHASHPCVNGYCQLERLGGINVGGPLNVDDLPSININVNATNDYVQDVEVRNCVVRNFAIGYNVEGSTSDNGVDGLEVHFNEFRASFYGMRISTTDATDISSNWAHDNVAFGMRLHGNWGVTSVFDTVENNGWGSQVLVHAEGWTETHYRPSRWIKFVGGDFIGPEDVMRFEQIANTGAQAPCNSNTALCDLWVSGNYVECTGLATGIFASPDDGASWLLRDNWIHSSRTHVYDPWLSNTHRCWDKNNNCYIGDRPTICQTPLTFARPTTCWY